MSSGLFKMFPTNYLQKKKIMYISYTYTYLPTPPLGQHMTQGQFLSGVITGLNSEFSFP